MQKKKKNIQKQRKKIYIEDIKLMNGIVDLLLGYDNTYLMSIIRKQPPFMKGLQNFPGYEISDKDMMDFFKYFSKEKSKKLFSFFAFGKILHINEELEIPG